MIEGMFYNDKSGTYKDAEYGACIPDVNGGFVDCGAFVLVRATDKFGVRWYYLNKAEEDTS